MKNFKMIYPFIFIPLFLLFLNSIIFSQVNNNNSIITINSNRDTYLESEPIWIEVEVNIPKEMILERTPSVYPCCGSWLILTNDNGDTLERVDHFPSWVITKAYRNHYFNIIRLLYFFGVPDDFPNSDDKQCYKLLPGGYHIQFVMRLYISNTSNDYYSNIVKFTVEKPVGSEFNARSKLLEIEDYRHNTIYSKESDIEVLKMTSEFKELFPNSRYIQKIENFDYVAYVLSPNFKDSSQSYLLKRLEEDPGDYYNIYCVYSLLNFYKDMEEDYINKLYEILESKKGTLLEKIINSVIEERIFKRSLINK